MVSVLWEFLSLLHLQLVVKESIYKIQPFGALRSSFAFTFSHISSPMYGFLFHSVSKFGFLVMMKFCDCDLCAIGCGPSSKLHSYFIVFQSCVKFCHSPRP